MEIGNEWILTQGERLGSNKNTMREFLVEYWQFVRAHKKYWLIPIFLVLGLMGGLIVFTQGNVLAPFLYTFF